MSSEIKWKVHELAMLLDSRVSFPDRILQYIFCLDSSYNKMTWERKNNWVYVEACCGRAIVWKEEKIGNAACPRIRQPWQKSPLSPYTET